MRWPALRRPLAVLLMLSLALGLVGVRPAAAHPLGNFSVNRYSGLEIGPDRAQLRYVLDLAEIPTLQELNAAGLQATTLDETARARLLAARTRALIPGLRLTVGGQPAEWVVQDASLELLPGQADLPTLRLSLALSAAISAVDGDRLEYRDLTERGRAGWQEVVLRAADGVSLAGSDVPTASITGELRHYPEDPSVAPLSISSASATLRLAPGARADRPAAPAPPQPSAARFAADSTADRLTGFLRNGAGDNPLSLLLALAVAAALGAMHALGPGHGKSVVGAYLVGSRGTARHAAFLGLTITLTHTLGVYALGLVTLVAAQYILPEQLYPVLGVLSGLLVVAIGLSLARMRLAALLGGRRTEQGHHHAHGDHHGHSHDHPQAHAHHHSHEHGHAHSHGGKPHAHLPPGADGSPVTLKSLLALGVSGGLLPCPSALVVLLAAISFQNVAFGMALVAAFSVGLAAVLTAIGLALVYGGRWLGRSHLAGRLGGSPLARAVPALSALAITAAGLVITFQAARTFL